ncbi:hypothetical protein NM688_g2437 [Phlebia brevispora]|uniref:Uncharacterized protein n=1 Tax=Phlebia brevispora TaxID=194682 RepID=A0ACC1T8T3_9APHY|nr:hypothetical protein NM688_g2437 [Phlebia brevispora]
MPQEPRNIPIALSPKFLTLPCALCWFTRIDKRLIYAKIMASRIQCPGCLSYFTLTGYSRHLTQSKDPRCVAVRTERDTYFPRLSDSDSDSDSPSTDGEARHFAGDYFAGASDYQDDEFGWEENSTDSDSDDDLENIADESASDSGYGIHWDPPMDTSPSPSPEPMEEESSEDELALEHRRQMEEYMKGLHRKPAVVVRFGGEAGKVIQAPIRPRQQYDNHTYQASLGPGSAQNPWYPFTSKLDWEVAKWAKLRGPGDTAFSELLSIAGVRESLKLSYKTAKELNKVIDKSLPGRPKFHHHKIKVGRMSFDVFYRNVLECTESLYGDPEFAPYLVFVPEKHYKDNDQTVRLYHDMHTGKWWWGTQRQLEHDRPGATIIPIIISSDKTQLTLFRNKTAYPIYMTIGNLPKEIRRKPSHCGQILLGYLPTTKLEHIKNDDERRRALADLFHACVKKILKPLETAGIEGIPMQSGDGVWRRCHPIFATFVGDYPEQTLVTLVKNGTCPVCPIPENELGSGEILPPRELGPIHDTLTAFRDGLEAFEAACKGAGIKAVAHPFWENLPSTRESSKHLVAWLQAAYGPTEIDARCRCMPPNHHVRVFSKGISVLSRVSGEEHRDICRILLGLVVDLHLPSGASSTRLVRAVRAMLDFLYLAQYPVHSDETLRSMEEALATFHENKQIFVDLGIRDDFDFPKLHNIGHYAYFIKRFGTTDNYNTEYTERLHIDYAKNAYRASNKKDEFLQMTVWLERREKVHRHDRFVQWRLTGHGSAGKDVVSFPHVILPQHFSERSISFDDLANDYGAYDIRNALASWIAKTLDPSLSGTRLEHAATKVRLPLRSVPVYHKIRLANSDPYVRLTNASDNIDVVHVQPARLDKHGHAVPGKFDVVLVNTGRGAETGLRGYRAAQVRAVFCLKANVRDSIFPSTLSVPSQLAYIEWFKPFAANPERHHLMYKITKAYRDPIAGFRDAAVVPVSSIKRFPDAPAMVRRQRGWYQRKRWPPTKETEVVRWTGAATGADVPQELFDKILSHLNVEEYIGKVKASKRELGQICLVCRRWIRLIRPMIFKKLELRNRDDAVTLLRFLRCPTSVISGYIKRLYLKLSLDSYPYAPWIHTVCSVIHPRLAKKPRLELRIAGPLPSNKVMKGVHEMLPRSYPCFSSDLRALSLSNIQFKSFGHLMNTIGEMPALERVQLKKVTWNQPQDEEFRPPPARRAKFQQHPRYQMQECTDDVAVIWLRLLLVLPGSDRLDELDADRLYRIISLLARGRQNVACSPEDDMGSDTFIIAGDWFSDESVVAWVILTSHVEGQPRHIRAVALESREWQEVVDIDWKEVDGLIASLSALQTLLFLFRNKEDVLLTHRDIIAQKLARFND